MTIKFNIKVLLIIVSFSFLSSDYSVQAEVVSADDGLIIIVDNSGSMQDVFKGDTKINGVKKAINEAMNNRDFDFINTGLLEMGGQCEVKELVSPGLNNRQIIRQASDNIRPHPYYASATPMAQSIYKAVNILQKYQGNKQIILLSDGGANCEGKGEFPLSACDMVASLQNQGIDFSFKLIGYAVENSRQFECIKNLSKDGEITYNQIDGLEDIALEIKLMPDQIPFESNQTLIEQLIQFLFSIKELMVVIIAIIFLIVGFVPGNKDSQGDSNNIERDNIKKW